MITVNFVLVEFALSWGFQVRSANFSSLSVRTALQLACKNIASATFEDFLGDLRNTTGWPT